MEFRLSNLSSLSRYISLTLVSNGSFLFLSSFSALLGTGSQFSVHSSGEQELQRSCFRTQIKLLVLNHDHLLPKDFTYPHFTSNREISNASSHFSTFHLFTHRRSVTPETHTISSKRQSIFPNILFER